MGAEPKPLETCAHAVPYGDDCDACPPTHRAVKLAQTTCLNCGRTQSNHDASKCGGPPIVQGQALWCHGTAEEFEVYLAWREAAIEVERTGEAHREAQAKFREKLQRLCEVATKKP